MNRSRKSIREHGWAMTGCHSSWQRTKRNRQCRPPDVARINEKRKEKGILSRICIERAYIIDNGWPSRLEVMKMNTVFDDLADLVLIEILSYLSCADALCAFTCLNDHCTQLLVERDFFRQINLSAAYARQFQELLKILPLNNIETLVIDRTGSPLQLSRWLYLPRLTRLHLRGVREYDSVLFFVLLHAATLTHITIESDAHSVTVSVGW